MITPHHGPASGDRSDSSAHPDDLRDPAPANTGSYEPPDDDDPSLVPTVVDEPCDLPAHFAATITRGDVPPLPGGNGGDDNGDDDDRGRNRRLPRYTVDLDEKSRPRPTLRTVLAILGHDPQWFPRFRYNERSGIVEVAGEPLTDTMVVRIAAMLDQAHGVCNPAVSTVDQAIDVVGKSDRFDPVRDWLETLTWDGKERLPTLLAERFAAEVPRLDGDAGRLLLAAYGRCTLIAAVARAFQPGCKHDTVLVLRGPQGIGKSESVKALVPNLAWWSETKPRVGQFRTAREAGLDVAGKWIIELAEVDKWLGGADAETVKAYLSGSVDRYDDKYKRHAEDRPRRNVFIGTTNRAEVLDDPTGSRRLWPVTVGSGGRQVDREWITVNRDQLWAEAVHRFRNGEPWHLTPEEEAWRIGNAPVFEDADPWGDALAAWLDRRDPMRPYFTMDEALERIGVPPAQRDNRASKRVALLLRRIGYDSRQWKPPGYDRRAKYWGKA